MSTSWKFEVIHNTLQEEDNRLSVSMLCDIAGVSRSGYYRWVSAANVRNEKEIKDREDFELILKAYITSEVSTKEPAAYTCVCCIGTHLLL